MSDLHEVVFRWPYNAKEVIVTGTFDMWARSVRLNKGKTEWSATVRVPWEQKVLYKFVVDGKWAIIDQAPTEADWRGNINNVYYAPTKPQEVDTPDNEQSSARKPEIAIVPAPVPVEEKKAVPGKPEEPAKGQTPVVDKKGPSLPVDEKDTSSTSKVTPTPAVSVPKDIPTPDVRGNGGQPNIPLAKTDNKPPAVLPTPPTLKAPLVIVPVNDASTADKQPPVTELPTHTEIPSTHTPPINNPRRTSTGTSSSNTLLSEKKGEGKKEPKPEEAKQPNGTSSSTAKPGPAEQPPSTPVKSKAPTLPTTPVTPATFSSPPTTPRKSRSSRSTSSSSSSSSSQSGSTSRKRRFKKKRDSFVRRLKHLFTPEKEKKEHKREKSLGSTSLSPPKAGNVTPRF